MKNVFPQFWEKSLKTRITLSILAIFLLFIWIFSYHVSGVLRKDLEELIHQQQTSTVKYVADSLFHELEGHINALEKISGAITLSEMRSPKKLQHLLEDRPVLAGMFSAGIFVLDSEGTAIASIPAEYHRIGINYIDRDYIAKTLREGTTKVGTPIHSKSRNTPVVGFASPIFDNGKVIGALIGAIDLTKPNFVGHLANHNYGYTGGYMVVDRSTRTILVATDTKRNFTDSPKLGVNPLMDTYIKDGKGDGIVKDSQGVTVISAARSIDIANWVVVVRMPIKEAFAPLEGIYFKLWLAPLLMVFFLGGLIWLVLHWQFKPMLNAVKSLKRAGDKVVALPILKYDEVGLLLRSFNALIATLEEQQHKVSQLAFYDALTHLPNRYLLDDRLNQAMSASKRSGSYAALMFLDLDNFKVLNDTHGHTVGDALLIEAAARLKNCVREIDTVARFGGDEFVVILGDLEGGKAQAEDQALLLAEKIKHSLSESYELPSSNDAKEYFTITHSCTVSIGIVMFMDHEAPQNDILKWADTAMYEAKNSGDNQIRFYKRST